MNKKLNFDLLVKAKKAVVKYAKTDEIDNNYVKDLRKKLNMSQNVFASIIGVTKKTIEKWEQGKNPVKGPASKLLFLINKDQSIINELYSVEFINDNELLNTYLEKSKFRDFMEEYCFNTTFKNIDKKSVSKLIKQLKSIEPFIDNLWKSNDYDKDNGYYQNCSNVIV